MNVRYSRKPQNQGLSRYAIASDFKSSPEYAGLHGTQSNTDFVYALYEGALGRALEPGGGQGWVDALNHDASPASVVLGIAESPEATLHSASAVQNGFHIA